MLYSSVKTGVGVHISDLGLNVLMDLLGYAAEVDSAVLAAADGKTVRSSKPMSVAEMTLAGRLKG